MSIPQLARIQPISDEGIMNDRFLEWTRLVTRLQILTGSGSPEAVIEAFPVTLYMDTAGTAGSILYIKRDADIAGDRTKGWILV